VTDVQGLFFLGLTWQWTRGSALIGWVKDDAEFLAGRIATHARRRGGADAPVDGETLPEPVSKGG
jgi:putative flavoprotein involved in K+ transport